LFPGDVVAHLCNHRGPKPGELQTWLAQLTTLDELLARAKAPWPMVVIA
jgi:hypothetical protein